MENYPSFFADTQPVAGNMRILDVGVSNDNLNTVDTFIDTHATKRIGTVMIQNTAL